MVDYAKESEPFAAHVCGLGSVRFLDGPGDAGEYADPSFSGSAVDFGLLLKGLGSHFDGPRWWRESAGLQVQGFLFSKYPVEVGLHLGFEFGFAFFCCWHFFHPVGSPFFNIQPLTQRGGVSTFVIGRANRGRNGGASVAAEERY